MASSTGTGWAQLRQQARSLETQVLRLKKSLELRTDHLSDRDLISHLFAVRISTKHTPEAYGRRKTNRVKITRDSREGMNVCIPSLYYPDHAKRETLVSQLSRLLDSEATLTASALKQNNLSRHREVLLEHRRELARLRSQIQDARNRANLLSNVRSDIDAYHSSNPEAAEAEYMLDERARIDNSHSMADSVLSQAYAVNESFGLQRETLASINRRITGAASQVPGLNSLIGRISAKKRRDGFIMGGFIAFCFLMLLYFM